jgi:hypothetical protein
MQRKERRERDKRIRCKENREEKEIKGRKERESEREESYFVCNKVQGANLGGEKSFVQTVMKKGRGTRCGGSLYGTSRRGAMCKDQRAGAK